VPSKAWTKLIFREMVGVTEKTQEINPKTSEHALIPIEKYRLLNNQS
jgi:hypothetical protein